MLSTNGADDGLRRNLALRWVDTALEACPAFRGAFPLRPIHSLVARFKSLFGHLRGGLHRKIKKFVLIPNK